ncbi:Lin1244/Lin1753 domain-containing protein [Eubacterium coprostanoligenes]|uniref:Lin1244/Lin1753 domain-containing protein n=1 Tax=Eubacterium coprostanoligenes TaxID=290054 RepID=UPI002A832B48|nr:Lin1244/Lin1753 domain-containing protein [Eubacterium coprostanoligenes]MDY4698068.1 DUF4373 domain-containing protein [Eubacterium coprostanoligenes]
MGNLGRNGKIGLDYFSHSTKPSEEEDILFSSQGLEGKGLYYTIQEKIFENGYFFKLDNIRTQKILSYGIDKNYLSNFLQIAFDLEIYNKHLFEEHQILTSKQIQLDYLFACKRRKTVNFISEYFLLRKQEIENLNNKEDEMQEKICLTNLYGIDVDINSFYVNNNQNNVNTNKQIEKESDIDNDIENDTDTETNTYIKEKSERLCQKNTKAKNERIKTTDKNGNEQNSNLDNNEFREFFSNKNYS